jgi:hypothetical protein
LSKILGLIVTILFASYTWGCKCGFVTFGEFYSNSEYVFEATANKVVDSTTSDGLKIQKIMLKVIKSFKGNLSGNISVYSVIASPCEFDVGGDDAKYLFFAAHRIPVTYKNALRELSNRIIIDNSICGKSRRLSEADTSILIRLSNFHNNEYRKQDEANESKEHSNAIDRILLKGKQDLDSLQHN